MSRIGKKPINIPTDVTVTINGSVIETKGKLGQLSLTLHPKVSAKQADNQIFINVYNEQEKECRSLWGLSRTLVANILEGVSTGFEKRLELHGVGYRVAISENTIILHVGYSHPVEIKIPQDIHAAVEKNIITISGCDKQKVGEFAAKIRRVRKPEPYKGKGIKYADEVIRRKAGKTGKASSS